MHDELKCPVCTDICTAPSECLQCSHLFCAECITNINSCPLCRKSPFITRPNAFATRLVNNVKLMCKQCGQMVIRPQLEIHQRTSCEARLRHCSFPGCNFVVSKMPEALNHIFKMHSKDIWANFDNMSKIFSSTKAAPFQMEDLDELHGSVPEPACQPHEHPMGLLNRRRSPPMLPYQTPSMDI